MSGTTTQPPAEPTWAKPAIAIVTQLLFVACLGVAWWTKNDQGLALMIGAVIANATTVFGYYFGSSSGSAAKTNIMASQTGSTP